MDTFLVRTLLVPSVVVPPRTLELVAVAALAPRPSHAARHAVIR